MIDDEILAVRETKARAVAAFGEDRVLAIANWGAGVWLADNSFIPKEELPEVGGRKVYEVRLFVESYGSPESVRRIVVDQLGYTGLIPKGVRVEIDEEKSAALF